MFEIVKKKFRSKVWQSLLFRLAKVNDTPLIVLGNQKSGTTAIAALLAEYTGFSITLDLPNIWGTTVIKIYAGDVAFADFVGCNTYYFSKDIIKEPELTFLYSQVKEFFYQAKYLMIVRDPRDNIRSILNRLKIRGDMEDIGSNIFSTLPPGWQIVINGQWLGLHGETYIEMLAERWNYAADVYLQHSQDVVLIRYEDFVSDKVRAIERLAHQLGMAQANDISDKVNIQYQPKGDHSVSWEEFFGEKNLLRIEHICGSRMPKFGYTSLYFHHEEP